MVNKRNTLGRGLGSLLNTKNDSNNLRLMSYNVWSNGLISNSRVDEHRRIFSSANAHPFIFFQRAIGVDKIRLVKGNIYIKTSRQHLDYFLS